MQKKIQYAMSWTLSHQSPTQRNMLLQNAKERGNIKIELLSPPSVAVVHIFLQQYMV
jgi:hypothetical protein